MSILIKLIVMLYSFVLFAGKQADVPLTQQTPMQKIQVGMWTEGLYDPTAQKLQPEKLKAFEKLTQKSYTIAHYYRGWEALIDPGLIIEFSSLRRNGWIPMLSANPYFFAGCPAGSLPLYQAIAQGKCDEFLHHAGKNLSRIDQQVYFRFAWEMNNKDMEWSIPYTKSRPEDFILAWRRVHTIFTKEKADHLIWVFCPNIPDVPEAPYVSLYPGDQYVDTLCLDGYNWGTTQSWSQWTSFSGVFTSAYTTLTQIAPTKPLMLGEVNTTDQGGDKAAWYDEMFSELPKKFPKIHAVVFFNEDKSKKEHVNWSVDISEESLRAFIRGVQSTYFK